MRFPPPSPPLRGPAARARVTPLVASGTFAAVARPVTRRPGPASDCCHRRAVAGRARTDRRSTRMKAKPSKTTLVVGLVAFAGFAVVMAAIEYLAFRGQLAFGQYYMHLS